ncbi:MAG: hypothetical protein VKM34_04460, partial [Cyanobacteriota bacterium]|nr:hypothetical protein [Cyanobacteriota bacterium]
HPLLAQLEQLQHQQPSWATAIRLTVLEGRSLRGCARELGVSPMTVCRWRRLGLDQLRQQLLTEAAAIA